MDGPSCKGLLEELRFGDVELDRCASCRGIWFDVGELESYRAARAKGSGPAPTPGFEANHEAPPLRCPGCKSATLESGRTKGDHDLRQCSVCGGIFVPRPSDEFVTVASISASSGLPSTFALVYGGVFGATLFASGRKGAGAAVAGAVSAGLIAAGLCARIVLGGHWASQMLSSLLLALALATIPYWILRAHPIRGDNDEAG